RYKDYCNIIFTGYRSDIPRLLALSDIFCLPSYREGMPRSIIEAMSMENAVIATNIRGSREEVDHGTNGFLVELNEPKSLVNSIFTLANNKPLLDEFQYNAREKAVQLYDEKKVVQKQMDIFRTVMERLR